jgi:hypothetical protein
MKMNSNIGAVALAINAQMKAEKQDDIALLAMRYLVFHKAPAIAFKKGGRKRDEAFSEGLVTDVKAAIEAALSTCFEGIEVSTSAYVKAENAVSKERKAVFESLVATGLDAADLFKTFPEFAPKEEEPTAEVEESAAE